MTGYMNIDYQELADLHYQDFEFKPAARRQARERGAREHSNDKDSAIPLSLFRTVIEHARTHYPVAHTPPSNMMLYLVMLRITSVLSTPEKQVVCIPERSWLRASIYGPNPYVPEGLIHHMLIRADNDTATSIVSAPVERTECTGLRAIETAHIFEAKTKAGYLASRPFVLTHLKHWCWVTGKGHVRAAVNYGDEWQFVTFHAPQLGRRECVQTLRQNQLAVKIDDIDLILGLLLDMVENTSEEHSEYFQVKLKDCIAWVW